VILDSKAFRNGATERTRAKVNAGWSVEEIVLVRGAKRTEILMIMYVRRKIVGRVCREGLYFMVETGKLETNSAVDRLPVKSRAKMLGVRWSWTGENSSEIALSPLG